MAAARAPGAGRCLVLGAGAQGLACALRLWEQGWEVVVLARDWLEGAASSGAGAIWEYPPFLVEPQREARRWVLASLGPLRAIADQSTPSSPSGVRVRRSYYVYRDPANASGMFSAAASEARLNASEGLPPSGLVRNEVYSYGFSYDAPVISMRQYLPWLMNAVGQLPGVRFVQATVRDRSELHRWKLSEAAQLVVNCLGLGSRQVFDDETMYGIRGDLAYVVAPGVERLFNLAHVSDEDNPDGLTYMVPQGNGIVALAGTAEKAPEQEGPTGPRQEQVASLVRRNVSAFPCLGPSPVVAGSWSGLRPHRAGGIRLELVDDHILGPTIHNYGHGGSGVVTSWGCAADVASLALKVASATHVRLRVQPLPLPLSALPTASRASRL